MTNERRGRPVAVITGASQGVGRAAARLFAAEGWDVGLVARGAEGLAAAAGEARAAGARVTVVNLPAINTPHFEVARSRLPFRPRPVPPVYQPELAARAIVAAARAAPRELTFGTMAASAILGDKVAPGLLDRYLARIGYRSQLTPRPSEPGRWDNIVDPLPGDRGAHGTFDGESADRSANLWLQVHRRGLLAAGAAAAAFLILRRRR